MTTAVDTSANPEFDFGDRLRAVRRKVAKMTQAQMAAELDVARPRYEAWESSRNTPDDIVAVAKRIEFRWRGQVTAAWMLGVDESQGRGPDGGGYAPSQPTGYQDDLAARRRRRAPIPNRHGLKDVG